MTQIMLLSEKMVRNMIDSGIRKFRDVVIERFPFLCEELKGGLQFDNVIIRRYFGLYCKEHFRGDLQFNNSFIGGGLGLESLTIDGNLYIKNTAIEGDLEMGISRDIEGHWMSNHGTVITGDLNLSETKIKYGASLEKAFIHGKTIIKDSVFKENLYLGEATFGERDFGNETVLDINHITIGEKMILDVTINFCDAVINGALNLKDINLKKGIIYLAAKKGPSLITASSEIINYIKH